MAEAATEAYCSGATSVATLHGACAVTWLQLLAFGFCVHLRLMSIDRWPLRCSRHSPSSTCLQRVSDTATIPTQGDTMPTWHTRYTEQA